MQESKQNRLPIKEHALTKTRWANSSAIAEDARARSIHMREIIKNTTSHIVQLDSCGLPRVLIQFWDNAKSIPADVRECMDSWRQLEDHGFERVIYDDESAGCFISRHFGRQHRTAFERCEHPAMRSDYFRLCFIMKRGGFYVDADNVCQGGNYEHWFHDNRLKIQPLCYNFSTDLMVETADFITNPSDAANLLYYAGNDPLIAPANHPVIRMALERSTRILLRQMGDRPDIQWTTGPGNLTASLVQHALESERKGQAQNFVLITDWDTVSASQWTLNYRNDKRNWRLW